jgi:hypothetical protein
MKFGFVAIVLAGLIAGLVAGLIAGLAVADPAAARVKHRHAKRQVAQPTRCLDRAERSSWSFLAWDAPAPQWNGCAPPVYFNGDFVGQDPDVNVRATLRRDPDEGYHPRND